MTATFTAEMSANPSGTYGSTYTVDLYTTGGQASQWVVNWGDATANTTLNAVNYSGGVFPAKLQVPHTYNSSSPQMAPITATATPTAGGSNSVAYFALSAAYGTGSHFSNSGETLDNAYGNYGSEGRDAMVIDHSTVGGGSDPFLGEAFVATPYFSSLTAAAQFAVTCESSSGGFDSRWGTDGTLVVPSFAGGSDVPYSIAMSTDGALLAVAGKCSTGWAIALITTSLNGGTYGSPTWESPSNFQSGQANAVQISSFNSPVIVAGTDGTHMVAAGLKEDGTAQWSGTGINSSGVETFALASNALQATATSVFIDDNVQSTDRTVIIGGTTTYCCSGIEVGSNFTLVAVKSTDGSLNPSGEFGTNGVVRTNFGSVLNHSTCCSAFSTDSLYGLAEWENGSTFDVTAVGSTNASAGTTKFALARYDTQTGNLDTGFGDTAQGIAFGPAGTAYAVVVPLAKGTSGTMDVAGTNGGDFVTAQFLGTAAGSLHAGDADPGFGNAGVLATDFGAVTNNSTDSAWSMGVEYDGNGNPIGVVVCGTSLQSGSTNGEIALADYLPSNKISFT